MPSKMSIAEIYAKFFEIKVLLLIVTWYNKSKLNFVPDKENKTHAHNDNKIKTADKASILKTKAKSTKVDLKETESNRVSIANDGEWC